MEKTELNKAHEAGRRASKLIRKGLFEEAAECHLEASRLLHELQQRVSDDSLVLRSLDEQAKYHKRQAELAHIRRVAFNKLTSKANSMEGAKATPVTATPGAVLVKKSVKYQAKPHHTPLISLIDEADSLLQILSERKYNPSVKENKVQVPEVTSGQQKPAFTIRPKNDADVIEELQMVNSNLRNLVDQLLSELHEVRQENKVLKKRLESYETGSSSSSVQSEFEKTSFMTSLENYKPRELPELAPLETPDFDFTAMS